MFGYKPYRYIRLIQYAVIAACIFLTAIAHAQEAETVKPPVTEANAVNALTDTAIEQSFQITEVNYIINGHTRQYPLSQAVPIDTARIFNSKEALQHYLEYLEQQFKNIRVIQSVLIDADYGDADHRAMIPVTLTVTITDTWSFIAVPYPSFDSNSGFQAKIKLQDFNFIGMLQPLKADIVYRTIETDQHIFSSAVNFALPFKAGIFDLLWDNNFQIVYAYKEAPKINFASGLGASLKLNKHLLLAFGLLPELIINDRSSSHMSIPSETRLLPHPQGKESQSSSETQDEHTHPHTTEQASEESTEHTDKKGEDGLGSLYYNDRYYFKTTLYVRADVMITDLKNFGPLLWTPFISLAGNWAFDGIQADELKTWGLNWGHTLSLSKVDWKANFRKGLSFSLRNTYSYRFYNRQKMNISFTAAVTGYYPFINRVGIYGRTQFFYHLFGNTGTQAGTALRGILNERIDTDTAFTFNLDIPVRLATLDFQAITGVAWTRFFNCDIQAAPFLDIALVHDKKTARYYHPADGWYAGGMEVIVYPEKIRSIYVRASLGFDLTELKNLSGLNGRAKRDGKSITEIFIGIGAHY